MTHGQPYRAAFVKQQTGRQHTCGLCPHHCAVTEDQLGRCRTRKIVDDQLVVTTYGRLNAASCDPVEKKPLFHFYPKSSTFSIASLGCNLICPFCQNHSLSRGLDATAPRPSAFYSPADVVELTKENRCRSISFTYSEPILMFEFARDVAKLASPLDIDIIFVSNGQATRDTATALGGFLQAANIDLKTFSKDQYRDTLGGSLKATLRTIEILLEAGVWVEITTLVIPEFNDSDDNLSRIAQFIADLSQDIPWHVSRFHPAYTWTDSPVTPTQTLRGAREIGVGHGLKYVYTGNLPGDEGEKTLCPGCGTTVVDRHGYRVSDVRTHNSRCKKCNEPIAGRGLP